MAVVRKSPQTRKGQVGKAAANACDVTDPDALGRDRQTAESADPPVDQEAHHQAARARRLRQGVVQFPMQILVPEETREALRQRSEDTGASIRHIILRSLAADGFPVPRMTRRRD
jgi:hypothetical protein